MVTPRHRITLNLFIPQAVSALRETETRVKELLQGASALCCWHESSHSPAGAPTSREARGACAARGARGEGHTANGALPNLVRPASSCTQMPTELCRTVPLTASSASRSMRRDDAGTGLVTRREFTQALSLLGGKYGSRDKIHREAAHAVFDLFDEVGRSEARRQSCVAGQRKRPARRRAALASQRVLRTSHHARRARAASTPGCDWAAFVHPASRAALARQGAGEAVARRGPQRCRGRSGPDPARARRAGRAPPRSRWAVCARRGALSRLGCNCHGPEPRTAENGRRALAVAQPMRAWRNGRTTARAP